jgi:hypothetical protein
MSKVVHRLTRDFPDMKFSLNGGVVTLDEALCHLPPLDGGDAWGIKRYPTPSPSAMF